MTRTKHMPLNPEKFEFDATVAPLFDDMAVRSIPGYAMCHEGIAATLIGLRYPPYSQVWDFGTSTGRALWSVRNGLQDPLLDYRGVDTSDAMLEQARAAVPFAEFSQHDLTQGLPPELERGNVAVAVYGWTLQFMPDFTSRWKLVKQTYDALCPGGVMFIFEKFLCSNDRHQLTSDRGYMWWRRANNYSLGEIKAKTLALRGSMKPWEHEELEAVLETCDESEWYWLYKQFHFGGVVVHKRA